MIQHYPRTKSDLLNDKELKPHTKKVDAGELRKLLLDSIEKANRKSSRKILDISDNASDEEVIAIYKKNGKALFGYFLKYYGDPASTAHQCYQRSYRDVAKEQFRNRLLQKERMNSGWRYQYVAKDAARLTERFHDISDVGQDQADFNVSIDYLNTPGRLTIYVSVKNRANTMGGQDWPKAIEALEVEAKADKNRTGAYLCVFGIAMERGQRTIRKEKKTNRPYSVNTEIWKSDFFWPFFANCKYEEIMTAVLDVLIETQKAEVLDTSVPRELIDSFGECCEKAGLLDSSGRFNDPHKLLRLFCGLKDD